MYEELIVTGAWWDFVDPIASNRIGALLQRTRPGWAGRCARGAARRTCGNGARRSCVSSFKADTDLALLYDCIEPNLADRVFFIRKAIGWALRQHAWTDAAEVTRYVNENRARLSPLSVREALKNVGGRATRRGAGG